MDSQNITKILKKEFKSFEKIAPDVFKVDQRYKDNLVAVKIFDCSESFLKDGFNIDTYQDNLISKIYYSQSGDVQWNYYLYFLLDNIKYKNLNNDFKKSIETNRNYARKFITTEKSIQDFLKSSLDFFSSENIGGLPVDLSALREEQLEKAGLSDVADINVHYTDVVPNYLKGKPKTDDYPGDESFVENEYKVEKIKRLHIKNFRKYPSEGPYEFGIINLIEGPNGVGKTSLLEAIEVWSCGRTFRDESANHNDAKIGIEFYGEQEISWNKPKESIFKGRDLHWYNKFSRKPKSDLYKSFNTFNFYNADAAARLSIDAESGSTKEINEALSSLIFGKFNSVLEERMERCLEKFNNEQKSRQKDFENTKKSIESASNIIKSVEAGTNDKNKLYEEFLAHIKIYGWIGTAPAKTKPSISKFKSTINNFLNILNESIGQLDWIRSISLNEVEKEIGLLSDSIKSLENLNKELEVKTSKHQELTQSYEENSNDLALIVGYKKYIANNNISALKGMAKKIEKISSEVSGIKSSLVKVANMDMGSYEKSDEILEILITDIKSSISNKKKQLETKNIRLNDLRREIEGIDSLLSQIKVHAKHILDKDKKRTNCPLCDAEYKPGELISRIEKIGKRSTSNEIFGELFAETKSLEQEIKGLEKKQSDINLILKSIQSLYQNINLKTLTLSDAVKKCEFMKKKLKELNAELDALKELEKEFESDDLIESEYLEILSGINKLEKLHNVSLSSAKLVSNFSEKLEKTASKIKTDIETLSSAIDKEIKNKDLLLKKVIKTKSGEIDEEEVYDRHENVSFVKKQFLSIKENVQFLETSSVNEIKKFLLGLIAGADGYLESITKLEESLVLYRQAKEDFNILNPKKILLEKELEKLNFAIKTINNALYDESKEKYLSQFINDNKKQITDTFVAIHSPKEFKEINFKANEKISLIREEGNSLCTIDQISSGQRSALALSIFITLNSKFKDGPPFILFDDPIVYIDELNLLSFMDYIRDIAISGARQIFFATANLKLANLFEKKFSFLGEDFKRIKLSR